ncbi:MAG: hypothetical protein ACRDRA_17560 [Pseudonocardiaceae bacterium]
MVSLSVPATLHEVHGQELAELLDTAPRLGGPLVKAAPVSHRSWRPVASHFIPGHYHAGDRSRGGLAPMTAEQSHRFALTGQDPGRGPCPGVRVVSDPQVEIELEAVCEVHHGSGCLVVRGEGDRVVLDARADHCCVTTLGDPATTLLFDALREWLG